LTSGPGGQLGYQVEGPERSRSVLRLSGYHQVDLRPGKAVTPVTPVGEERPPTVGIETVDAGGTDNEETAEPDESA
jgi:hypothetical protein